MENEIMNNIGEAIEENIDMATDVSTGNGFAKGFVVGIVTTLAIKGMGKAVKWGKEKIKAKKNKGKVDIPDDITNDEIDEIPE